MAMAIRAMICRHSLQLNCSHLEHGHQSSELPIGAEVLAHTIPSHQMHRVPFTMYCVLLRRHAGVCCIILGS